MIIDKILCTASAATMGTNSEKDRKQYGQLKTLKESDNILYR